MGTNAGSAAKIGLATPLSMKSAFRFPLQTIESRREMLWGALLLLLPRGGMVAEHGASSGNGASHATWKERLAFLEKLPPPVSVRLYHLARHGLLLFTGCDSCRDGLKTGPDMALRVRISALLTGFDRDSWIYDALLPKLRLSGNFQPVSGVPSRLRRRKRLLESLGHRTYGSCSLVARPSRLWSRFRNYQCLVLAGCWVQFRLRLQQEIQRGYQLNKAQRRNVVGLRAEETQYAAVWRPGGQALTIVLTRTPT
jgi:hypothetical protein